jgi:hypothetical protein
VSLIIISSPLTGILLPYCIKIRNSASFLSVSSSPFPPASCAAVIESGVPASCKPQPQVDGSYSIPFSSPNNTYLFLIEFIGQL